MVNEVAAGARATGGAAVVCRGVSELIGEAAGAVWRRMTSVSMSLLVSLDLLLPAVITLSMAAAASLGTDTPLLASFLLVGFGVFGASLGTAFNFLEPLQE